MNLNRAFERTHLYGIGTAGISGTHMRFWLSTMRGSSQRRDVSIIGGEYKVRMAVIRFHVSVLMR